MACSVRNSPFAFPAEVARYLMVEPPDVVRMIKLDRLPAIILPGNSRKITRVQLRDLHTWLRERSKNPPANLVDYETFLADFNESVGRKKTA